MAGVEGVEIIVLDHSVEVKVKDRQIFLSKEAWLALCACRTQFHEAFRFEKEIQRTLDKKRDSRVHTNCYKDKACLHIRSWWNGQPTKTGVSLLIGDWNQVVIHLDPSDEMRLGVEVLRRMLKEGKLLCTSLHPVQ